MIAVDKIKMQIQLTGINWDNFFLVLSQVSGYSILLPLTMGIFRLSTLRKELKTLLLFIFIAAAFELITIYMASIEVESISLFPIYILIEFFFFVVIYRMVLVSDLWKRVILYSAIVFAILFVLNLFFFWESDKMSSYIRSLESILIIVFTLAYFYQAIENLLVPSLNQDPMFWVNTALLVYFSGNLIFFIISNYLLEQSRQLLMEAYLIHSILIIIRNLLFTIGLWMKPQT